MVASYLSRLVAPESSPGSNAQQLADDEAVISKYNMGELINYCLRVHDPGWDESNPDNTQTVEGMINVRFVRVSLPTANTSYSGYFSSA